MSISPIAFQTANHPVGKNQKNQASFGAWKVPINDNTHKIFQEMHSTKPYLMPQIKKEGNYMIMEKSGEYLGKDGCTAKKFSNPNKEVKMIQKIFKKLGIKPEIVPWKN